MLGVQAWLLTDFGRISRGMADVGLPPALFVASMLFLAGIAIASGIGMWLGRRWGWWVATFYYVYGIARAANGLFTVMAIEGDWEASARGPEYYYIKFAGRILVHLLILLYFFKPNVLEYFGTTDVHRGKAIGKLVTVTAVLAAIATGMAIVAG